MRYGQFGQDPVAVAPTSTPIADAIAEEKTQPRDVQVVDYALPFATAIALGYTWKTHRVIGVIAGFLTGGIVANTYKKARGNP